MDAESVRNMQSNLAVTNKQYCQSCILLVLYIIQSYDARKLKHKIENNSFGRSYERGVEGLVPILLLSSYTCFGVLLENYTCLVLLQLFTANEGTNFRILIKVVYKYFTYSHFTVTFSTAVANTTHPRNGNRPKFINLIVM